MGTHARETATVTEAISAHHREMNERLTAEVASLEQGAGDGGGLVRFLSDELLPHAAGEERHLYPVVSALITRHGVPTATMSLDHEYIESSARRIEMLMRQLRSAADEEERAALRQQLVRAAVQLEAVVRLHTEKEEHAYLPLIARYTNEDDQRRMLDELHETAAGEHGREAPDGDAHDPHPSDG